MRDFITLFSGLATNRTVAYPVTRRWSCKTGANGWAGILRSHSACTSLRVTKACPTTESLSPSRVFGNRLGQGRRGLQRRGTASPPAVGHPAWRDGCAVFLIAVLVSR